MTSGIAETTIRLCSLVCQNSGLRPCHISLELDSTPILCSQAPRSIRRWDTILRLKPSCNGKYSTKRSNLSFPSYLTSTALPAHNLSDPWSTQLQIPSLIHTTGLCMTFDCSCFITLVIFTIESREKRTWQSLAYVAWFYFAICTMRFHVNSIGCISNICAPTISRHTLYRYRRPRSGMRTCRFPRHSLLRWITFTSTSNPCCSYMCASRQVPLMHHTW